MGQIEIFQNPEFGEIRTMVMSDGQIGFVGKDVCDVLGYSRARDAIQRHVDEDDAVKYGLTDSLGRTQQTTFINESGLYALILSSKLPGAIRFKRWVTSEVLPQIRRTGGYIPIKADDSPEELMARALIVAKKTIEQKNQLLEAQRPMVRFAEAVTSSGGSILIGELAKLLTQNGHEIGRTRLFRWLRENGYLFKKTTEPIQKWVEKGIFETHETVIQTNHGERIRITTKVTGKGQQYFIDIFMK